MSRWQRILAAAAVVAVLVCAAAVVEFTMPAPAHASSSEVSMLMDDNELIYSSPRHMVQTLHTLSSLGVDTVKVSMVWQLVAPNAYSKHRPHFDATDPAAYPPGAWSRWDTLVQTAQQLGMQVYFLMIGPSPTWAVPPANRNKQGPLLGWMPSSREYRQFVQAIGRRYSGSYVPPGSGTPISRVRYWGIWNEPNERSWLSPVAGPMPGHRFVLIQPYLYRQLVDAGWGALAATGHAKDTIMISETANRGVWTPGSFARALYCVGSNLRPLRGAAASALGCPTSGSRFTFVRQHPGLFKTSYAHHPYAFNAPPDRPFGDPTFITIHTVPSLERMLQRIFAAYGQHRRGGVPLYLTEWGYKTNPPNPYSSTSPAVQAAWLNEGEYLTWREPYVHGLTQFLLVDSPPKAQTPKNSALYWSSFQTGLEYLNGMPKPSFDAFRVPIWLPAARHGGNVTVWGQLRPVVGATSAYGPSNPSGAIDFQPRGSTSWQQLAQVQGSSPEGYVLAHVSIPGPGLVRLDLSEPGGAVYYSRSVAVS